jgi:hypothetical protein
MTRISGSEKLSSACMRCTVALTGLIFSLLVGACTEVVSRIEPPQTVEALRAQSIVGLTTNDGRMFTFDPETEVVIQAPEAGGPNISIQATVNGAPLTLGLADVQRIWVTQQKLSPGGRTALITLGVVAAVALIANSGDDEPSQENTSCPFVYAWNGKEFVLNAEPYGGATTRGLARDDYSELEDLVAQDGEYRLLVRNELEETQYTDLMELVVVDHAAGRRAIVDEWGQFHTIASPQPPISALDHHGNDLRPWLEQKDHRIWEALPVADADGSVRTEIILTFPKPQGARQAKLVSNAATGTWGAAMVREMLELHGRQLDGWYALVDSEPAAPDLIRAWNLREELYALQVHVEEPDGWMPAGVMHGGGPFAVEERVIPIDVSRVVGNEVRIRIRPPVGFWALDWLAIDYTEDDDLVPQTVAFSAATTGAGIDVTGELASADGSYHEMPRVGDEFMLSARVPVLPADSERSVFLHSKGYYRLHIEPDGEPNFSLLREIENIPDRAAQLSVERFRESQQRVARQIEAAAR